MEKKWMIAIGLVAVLVVAAVAVVALNPGTSAKTKVTERGSDTLLELMQNLAEDFNAESKTASVQVSGGGSSVGITALIEKTVDVAQASRAMKSSEIENATAHGVNPVEWKVAIDGIAIIVNSDNPVEDITIEQLRGIYNGTYTNWNQLDDSYPDEPITAFGRQSTSGTFEFFKEHVMKKGDFAPTVTQETGNAQIASKVQSTEGGIGYVGIGYAKEATGAKILLVKEDADSQAYSPLDKDAVYGQDYALWRYLYLYTDGTPEGAVHDWISYVLSDEAQNIVEEVGFYKLPADVLTEMRNQLNA